MKEKHKEVISMPYVNIKITKEGNVTPEQKRALIEGATNLLHDVLGKNKSTTVVTIDEVDTDNWGSSKKINFSTYSNINNVNHKISID